MVACVPVPNFFLRTKKLPELELEETGLMEVAEKAPALGEDLQVLLLYLNYELMSHLYALICFPLHLF